MRSAAHLVFAAALLALAGCGPKTMQQRMDSSEKIASKADDLIREAEGQMAALEPDNAQRLLNDARKELNRPDAQLYPEYEMLNERLRADEGKLADVREQRERQEIARQVNERRRELAAVIARYEQAFGRLVAKDLSRADLDAFDRTSTELLNELKEDHPLVKRSPDWAREVKDHRELLERGAARTTTARARVVFLEGPGAASSEARRLLAASRKTKDPEQKLLTQREAVAKLEACTRGKEVIERNQALTMNSVWVDGKELAPAAVVKACVKDLGPAKKALAVQEKAAAKREAKRRADEARAAAKQAAKEKAEAKKVAAEEKKRLAAEKKTAAKQALKEKAEAKKVAAEEKKRLAAEKKAAAKQALKEKAEAKKKAAEEKKAAAAQAAKEKAEAKKAAAEKK